MLGAQAFVFAFEGDDMFFDVPGSLPGAIVGPAGVVSQSRVSLFFKALDPFSDNGWACVKEPCGWFDADLEGFLDHLITPLFFIFALFHNMVILVRTHKILASFQTLVGF